MSCLKKLQAALAAVPVQQPCTAAAVGSLHAAGAAAARHVVDAEREVDGPNQLVDACAQQGVPGACMPVLAWLAAGLRSGLPPVATQQAHELACALLGVVTAVLPHTLKQQLGLQQDPNPQVRGKAVLLLEQLGTIEALCQQLAQVAKALVETTITKGAASSSGSSSGVGTGTIPLQQQVALAEAWHLLCELLVAVPTVAGKDAVLSALLSSGLFQVLLEGSLLLLGADPAAYPQAPEVQQQLWDSLKDANMAACFLVAVLGGWISNFWADLGEGSSRRAVPPDGTQSTPQAGAPHFQPWMQPLFKLQVLMMAKMQWDARQCPEHVATIRYNTPWPAKALTRAVTQMISPCVAGDLLRQRAPGLMPHVRPRPLSSHASGRRHGKVAEECLCCVGPVQLDNFLICFLRYYECASERNGGPAERDALELGLLMEVAELYCLVCPAPAPALRQVWTLVMAAVQKSSSVLAAFAATCGEALISIVEYLTEDVLLVMNSPSTSTSAAGASSSSRRSSSGNRQPRYGGTDTSITLEDRLYWALDAGAALGLLLARLQNAIRITPLEAGDSAAAVQALLTTSNTLRLYRLLEATLRRPQQLGAMAQDYAYLVPYALPALHAVASNPAGSRALLSAITTASKRQRVLNTAVVSLIQAGGQPQAAAAGAVAAVPGAMGQALAQQLLQQPDAVVQQACDLGMGLVDIAEALIIRAAAVLDQLLAPAAAYLARGLPPGRDAQLWGLEALLNPGQCSAGQERQFAYKPLLMFRNHVGSIREALEAALAQQHAEPAARQATKLAGKAGGGAAEAEQLQQQLRNMRLGRGDTQTPFCTQCGACARCNADADLHPVSGLPPMLHLLADAGLLQRQEVLAAGDPAQWAAAVPPVTPADQHVAATALFAACKAAGAVAQLPQLLEQVQGIMAQQSWGHALVSDDEWRQHTSWLQTRCSKMVDWALLLTPLLVVLLPPQRAVELSNCLESYGLSTSQDQPSPDAISHVLGLLGHVVAPGAPGCSYPGCCSLEGRSEAGLSVQVCSKCRGAHYCCREHQVAHWKAGHKEVCQAVQAAAKQVCDVAAGRSDQGGDSQ